MNEIITENDYPVRGLWVLKSALGLLTALIILVSFFLLGVEDENLRFLQYQVVGYYLIISIAFAFFHIIITILRRMTFHYSVEDKFLILRQGILSKQQRHIPYGVIQNLFVKQDLFDRIFGLASLTIENASQGAESLATLREQRVFGIRVGVQQRNQVETVGFFGNKVNIPGLTKADAEILKAVVLRKMKENPIEDSQSGL